MRTLKIDLLACLLFFNFAFFCEDHDGPRTETVPFEAEFFTLLVSLEEDSSECVAPKNFLNTQQGEGTATLIGDFTTLITFCVDINTFEYENGHGSFVNENGEEIFFEGGGQVLPSDEPGYDLEFFDTFEITGGTGRFKGATGSLTTESYVNMTTNQTDHVWKGEITLVK